MIKYYKNFSPVQKKFLAANGIKPISEGVHPQTHKIYQVYELTEELSKLLNAFSEAKRKALGGESHGI